MVLGRNERSNPAGMLRQRAGSGKAEPKQVLGRS